MNQLQQANKDIFEGIKSPITDNNNLGSARDEAAEYIMVSKVKKFEFLDKFNKGKRLPKNDNKDIKKTANAENDGTYFCSKITTPGVLSQESIQNIHDSQGK